MTQPANDRLPDALLMRELSSRVAQGLPVDGAAAQDQLRRRINSLLMRRSAVIADLHNSRFIIGEECTRIDDEISACRHTLATLMKSQP
jgi:hypothetical protein